MENLKQMNRCVPTPNSCDLKRDYKYRGRTLPN